MKAPAPTAAANPPPQSTIAIGSESACKSSLPPLAKRTAPDAGGAGITTPRCHPTPEASSGFPACSGTRRPSHHREIAPECSVPAETGDRFQNACPPARWRATPDPGSESQRPQQFRQPSRRNTGGQQQLPPRGTL